MATFGELKSRIAGALIRNDLTTQIEDTINRVIRFYQSRHFWFNEEVVTITLNAGDAVVPNLPSDFLYEVPQDGLTIVFNQSRFVLKKVHPGTYDEINYDGQGLPYWYTNRNGQLLLYYVPDQAYDLQLYYVKNYPELTSDNQSNDWTNEAERLIFAKSMADLYLEQLHERGNTPSLYETYEQRADEEERQLRIRNNARIGTSSLITENIIDGGDAYYYTNYNP